MRSSILKMLVWVVCTFCVAVVLLVSLAAVVGREAFAAGVFSGVGVESPLTQSVAGAQGSEERAAGLSTPEALAEDSRSRTEFAGYRGSAGVALAKRVFGLGESAADMPQSDRGGAKITGYVGENVASEVLADGKHALLESSMPLRSVQGSGRLAPVSLSLKASESGYEPANPLVPVVISKEAAEGVSFQFGLRVAPAEHEALESAEVVGDSVFYPGTAKGVDFLLEPVPDGVEASWQLLSAEAPSEEALSFVLPSGASLKLSSRVPGAAEVMLEGRRVLLIMPATATQANGASTPVGYTVKGSTLVAHVDLSGNVDYPVMVDPQLVQEYGGGSGYWDGWGESGTEGAYFEGGSGNMGVLAGLSPNYGNGAWAARELYAPGWSTKEGSITRVDVRGLTHLFGPDSHLESGIVGGEAINPIWTYDGENPADSTYGQMNTGEEFKGRAAAFCAVDGEGYDGGPRPLCNEGFGGDYYHVSVYAREAKPYNRMSMIESTWVRFLDSSFVSPSVNSGKTTAAGYLNAFGNNEEVWLGPSSGAHIEYGASDKAFGIAVLSLQRWNGSGWETVASNDYPAEGGCDGVVCAPERSRELNYANLAGHVPDGKSEMRVEATDPSGITSYAYPAKLGIDDTAPHAVTVTGSDVSGDTINITEGQAGDQITVKATDGANGVASSGVKSLAVEVDNHQIGGYEGSCRPGPCTAEATWRLNGRELGVGVHELVVAATDNAGNIAYVKYTLIVHAAAPLAMGPGSVNPQSGDFALESTDVDLKDSAGALMVSRHYDSRNVKEGAQGPLGPQWSIGLGQLASLEVLESEGKAEGVMVTGPEGLSFFPAKQGGGFESPPGDSSLSLELTNSGAEYVLEDKKKGTSTSFTKVGSANQWMPSISRTSIATDTLTDTYTSVEAEGKAIVEPTEELAPHSTAKCPSERSKLLADEESQAKACRALFFYYGSESSEQPEAKGESESEWGWHANRLTKVVAVVWSTSAGKMEEEPVAEYSYDGQGRLRAEWDPRIKPALKTTYGYSSEGQVTAIGPPGQQPWLMSYGTVAEDSSAGRLIKIARPRASTALWAGQLPVNTKAPAISGSLVFGRRLAVSEGEWEHGALSYGYQWERCEASGQGCAPIDGATNANYTARVGDIAHRLRVQVTAANAGGSTVAFTALSAEVTFEGAKEEGAQQPPQAGSTIEYDVPMTGGLAPYAMGAKEVEVWGQKDIPVEGAAIFPEEHPQTWPATSYAGASVYYTDDEAHTVNVTDAAGGIATTEYHEGDVTRALTADNRERALKEASPAVAAEKLSTVSKYSSDGNELTEVTGPEHKVNLSGGEEVEARNHVRYFYDEEAPENEKGEAEEYGLVTKTTDGALLANGEEKDVRTTLTGYSGDKGEGWTLHAPTSTTSEPDGADLVSSTKYNKETGVVEETRAPGGNAEVVSPPAPSVTFGSVGSGNGQLEDPVGVAFGPEGDAWVIDQGNNRLERFTSSGAFVAAYGSAGSGEGQYKKAWGIAIGQKTGDVYVADSENDRVEELNSEGKFVRAWGIKGTGPGEFEDPVGIAIDGSGHVWVSDYGDDRVEEFSETGVFVRQFGSEGSGQGQFRGAAQMVFSLGMLYVVDEGNDRVQEFSTIGNTVQYAAQFGVAGGNQGQLERPWGIAALSSTGEIVVSDTGNNNIVEYTAAGKLLGSNGYYGPGINEFQSPAGVGMSSTGALYVADQYNDRISVWAQPEAGGAHMTYSTQFGVAGSGEGQIESPAATAVDASRDVWVSDNHSDRLEKFSPQGRFLAQYGSQGSEEKQLNGPTGIAINQATGDMYVGDCGNHRIQERNSEGVVLRNFTSEHLQCPDGVAIDSAGDVWVSDSHADEIDEYTATGSLLHAYGAKGTGDLQFENPAGIAIANEKLYVLDTKNDRVQELSLTGTYLGQFGSEGNGGGQLENPEGITANAAGDLFVSDTRNDRLQEFGPTGHYLESIGEYGQGEGQLNMPQGLAITAAGDIYVADSANHRVEKWAPDTQAVHDTKTIYYTPGSEAGIEACENKPQWAGLPCRTEPAAQPTDSQAEQKGEAPPDLPVVTTEYNMWLQPVKTIEQIGNKTRTKSASYEGERVISQTVEAGAGKPIDPVHDKYSSTLGLLIEQSQESEHEGAKTTSQTFNTLGQLESYTDSEGNATTYSYDQYGRPAEINYDATKLDHLADRELLRYQETTGQLAELEDLGGEGTFKENGTGTYKASHGPEGELVSETYPNNMTATYGYNSIGEGTSLTYTKNNHCTGSECEWFHDAIAPSIHGETMNQTSSLATESYRYEQPGRLAEVKETPAAEDCTTRIYAHSEEGDRTSLTTRKSGSGDCTASEGGTVERHTYDEANRNTDEGVQYEPLGNITKLPAADAGGHELTTEYYVNSQVQSQTQGETTNNYLYDPEGRARQTETIIKLAASITISHYPGSGSSAPSWTYNQTTNSITRNIAAFGGLAAVEEAGKEPALQIRDLQGNIVGTASPNETTSKPLTLERTSEYGVPTNAKPEDKYNWLGTISITSNLPSGSVVQDGATYVPQLGQALQTQAAPEPAVPNVVTPFVITVAPFVPLKYEEASGKTSEGGAPGGNVPDPSGEDTTCTGMKACVASRKKGRETRCFTKIYMGEKGGWVWVHAYAWCPGEKMQRASYLQACMVDEEAVPVVDVASEPECGDAAIGEQDPNQIYATTHQECAGSDIIYRGGLMFWLPGWGDPQKVFGRGYQCGESTIESYEEGFWALVEDFESTTREAGTS